MKLFFSTDEVAGHLDIPVSTLEFYIREFRIQIQKVGKNRRYTHSDIEKLQKIVDLINIEGFTLEGAKEKLKERGKETNKNEAIVERLKDIKKTLQLINDSIED